MEGLDERVFTLFIFFQSYQMAMPNVRSKLLEDSNKEIVGCSSTRISACVKQVRKWTIKFKMSNPKELAIEY